MLKFNFVPKSANRPFQNLDVNLGSMSDSIALGNPCNLKIYFIKTFAMAYLLFVYLTSTKCAYLDNLSTKTMIDSCCFIVIGKPLIKSMEIIPHFHYGIGKGCNKHVGCLFSIFICWNFMHLELYSAMSLFIHSQKDCVMPMEIVFWYNGWE